VQGWDGVVQFVAEQMKAFEHGTMWIEPAGVPRRRGRHGGALAVVIGTRARPRGTSAWARGRYAVVYTVRGGLVVRGREYPSADAALAAAGA
jgi:ketosteroid isomerase-like protein